MMTFLTMMTMMIVDDDDDNSDLDRDCNGDGGGVQDFFHQQSLLGFFQTF